MNQYWLVALIVLLCSIGLFGYHAGVTSAEVKCDKHDAAEAQTTINAQQHVITETETQNQISQGAENAYHTGINSIDSLYTDSVPTAPAAAGDGVRRVSTAACGTQTSKKYKLTPQQCDEEEAKCNALWNWAQSQAAVK